MFVLVESLLQNQLTLERTNSEPKIRKSFEAKILDASTGLVARRIKDDGKEENLVKGFDMPQDCERWVDMNILIFVWAIRGR